ncbi:sugar ABC transporter permease [Clostridium sp. YIM B02515]|uniref:Sugar ABC transporter permease n=1 Tax=Clostridium rhizosphaerae TaxID=2803861 RepID=A0ABS1T9M5_9CLOT|nr:sugar ABC transporter permease [Clostridium rhizosphaerae]MBL4936045.1 sugar ABC transporter permease [Clostridium rhizosphaerae]
MNTKTTNTNELELVYKHRLKSGERRTLWLSRLLIWVLLAITLFPLISIIVASLSKGNFFYQGTFFPKTITFENYTGLFSGDPSKGGNFPIWVKNSLILCVAVALIQLFMTSLGAYAFSRIRFKGRKNGLMALLILQMFPAMMTISAIYAILLKFDLLDNLYALILVFAGGSAYNIWLLKGYFDSLPIELDEAAMVDGATHWQVFTKIIIPLAIPMMVVQFLFSFIGTYSEYMISSIALKSPENFTLALGLRSFINNQFSANWTKFAAAAVLSSLPIVIVFMLLQRFIQKGLVAGAVKG